MAYPCDKRTLALILGYSERHIDNFQKEGMPTLSTGVRGRRNSYDSAAVIRWLEDRARSGRKNNTIDFNAARAELTSRQAEKAQIEIAKLRGDLIPLDTAMAIQAGIANAVREQLLALTTKVVIRHPELPESVRVELDTLINQTLNDLSEIRLSDQLEATLARHYESAETPAESEFEPVGG